MNDEYYYYDDLMTMNRSLYNRVIIEFDRTYEYTSLL